MKLTDFTTIMGAGAAGGLIGAAVFSTSTWIPLVCCFGAMVVFAILVKRYPDS